MNEDLRWAISVILLVLSLLVIVANFSIAVRWYVFKKRASMIPFFGGIAGMIGLLLLPMSEMRPFWWVPLILDLGCGLLLAGVAVEQFKKMVRR